MKPYVKYDEGFIDEGDVNMLVVYVDDLRSSTRAPNIPRASARVRLRSRPWTHPRLPWRRCGRRRPLRCSVRRKRCYRQHCLWKRVTTNPSTYLPPKNMEKRPNFYDVAKQAGVGTATVSRVINGGQRVDPKTLQRVQEVMKQLGYQPSQAARSLKGSHQDHRTDCANHHRPLFCGPGDCRTRSRTAQEARSRFRSLRMMMSGSNWTIFRPSSAIASTETYHQQAASTSLGQDSIGEALRMAANSAPDVVILDLGLPDMEGKDVISEVRAWSRVPIIVLSARDRESEKIAALDLGADDYVEKPFAIGELIARIRAALRHKAHDANESPRVEVEGLVVDTLKRIVTRNGEPVRLTPTEYDLLAILVRHAGRVVTHRQLLGSVWGPAHVEDMQYLQGLHRPVARQDRARLFRPHIIRDRIGDWLPLPGKRLVRGALDAHGMCSEKSTDATWRVTSLDFSHYHRRSPSLRAQRSNPFSLR